MHTIHIQTLCFIKEEWWKRKTNTIRAFTWLHLKSSWQMDKCFVWMYVHYINGIAKPEKKKRCKETETQKEAHTQKKKHPDSNEWALFSLKYKRRWYFAKRCNIRVESCFIYTRTLSLIKSHEHCMLETIAASSCRFKVQKQMQRAEHIFELRET